MQCFIKYVYIWAWETPGDFLGFPGFPNVKVPHRERYISEQLIIADFLMKFTDFCYHGNKGGSSENLNDSIVLADPQNPHIDAKFWDLS